MTIPRHINQPGWSSHSWSHIGSPAMRPPSLSSSFHAKRKMGMASTSKLSLEQLLLLICWRIPREATRRPLVCARTSGLGCVVPFSFSAGANLVIQLKDTYQVISHLKDQSGFGWDEVKGGAITVESESVWRTYVLVRSLPLLCRPLMTST